MSLFARITSRITSENFFILYGHGIRVSPFAGFVGGIGACALSDNPHEDVIKAGTLGTIGGVGVGLLWPVIVCGACVYYPLKALK